MSTSHGCAPSSHTATPCAPSWASDPTTCSRSRSRTCVTARTTRASSPRPASSSIGALPVRFVAAGQGQLEAEIRAAHEQSALGDRFRLLGYRDDATRVIAGADLFVLASHHEGLPVTVMEALTLGVPVVAPRVGGLPEVVTTGVNGILVSPDSPEALADGIEEAARTDRRAVLAANARTTGERFSSAAAIHRIDACYRELARR